MLALCSGRAAAQLDPDEPYGKVVKEIRLPELKWTKEQVILRDLVSKVGEVYTRDNAALDLERLDRLDFAWGQSGAKVFVGFGVFEKADMQRARVR